jgi:hypothetical protein
MLKHGERKYADDGDNESVGDQETKRNNILVK